MKVKSETLRKFTTWVRENNFKQCFARLKSFDESYNCCYCIEGLALKFLIDNKIVWGNIEERSNCFVANNSIINGMYYTNRHILFDTVENYNNFAKTQTLIAMNDFSRLTFPQICDKLDSWNTVPE